MRTDATAGSAPVSAARPNDLDAPSSVVPVAQPLDDAVRLPEVAAERFGITGGRLPSYIPSDRMQGPVTDGAPRNGAGPERGAP